MLRWLTVAALLLTALVVAEPGWFWRVRYWLYSADVTRGLDEGRGSKDNPLRISDMEPVMKMLDRLDIPPVARVELGTLSDDEVAVIAAIRADREARNAAGRQTAP